MQILVHDYAGHPFQVQLSRELSRRGHSVRHLYSADITTPRGQLTERFDDAKNLEIVPVTTGRPVRRGNLLARRRDEIAYAQSLDRASHDRRFDAVISANTPLDPQWRFQQRQQRAGSKFIVWLQDVYSVGIRAVLTRRAPRALVAPITAYYRRLEHRIIARSDGLICTSPDFISVLDIPPTKMPPTITIPNWAPIDDIPILGKTNPWSKRHHLEDRPCLVYSGTLGMKHNPQLLLDLADHLGGHPANPLVVVISEGDGASWLCFELQRRSLSNLLILPFEPFEEVPNVLATADVVVAILESEAGRFSVPSKILTYLAAGRPILASMPRENLAAKTILESQSGLVTPPTDRRSFVRAAARLLDDVDLRQTMAENARRYAESHFVITEIANRFEDFLNRVCDSAT